ncbi:MAG: enoyl-CoA hydratase/isomerase family protein [Rubrobacter sp.]|nr:enoyl-CoA hydratase/isomerase family protein [Rubrobacter sp.]
MPDTYEYLRIRTDEAVTTVSLARPDSHNALNANLIGELTRVFDDLAGDEGVRVVVLAGEGRSFCAGADVGYMRDTADLSYEQNLEDAGRLGAMFRAVDECPKPVVAKIRGAAMGGGAGLVAAADVAVADEGARFAFSEVRLGIAPATIAPFVVRKIGASHARSLFLTGERFGAARAREIGLVHESVPSDDLDTAVEEKVGQLLQGGPQAQAAVKALLRQLESVEPMDAPGLMSRLISELRSGEEGQEGLAAFLEKRGPRWRGGA